MMRTSYLNRILTIALMFGYGSVFAENRIITDDTRYSGSSPIVLVDGDLTISNGIVLTITNSATLIVNGDLHIRNKGEILVSNNALVMIKGIVIQENGQATLDNTSFFASGGYSGIRNKTTLPDPGSQTYIDDNETYKNLSVLAGIANNLIDRLEGTDIDFSMPAYVTTALGWADESISPLPIELTYFIARQTSNGVKFEWQTASEKDNDYFTIEYSTDALNFSELATVSGAGTSTEIINYEYNYSTNAAGVMYYRLRQTDYDGQSECSDIVALTLAGHQTANVSNIDIKVYPNPATDYVQINGDGIVSVEFVNASGRVLSAAGQQASYSVSNLPQGINYVIVHTTQGNAFRQFIKH